jgi:hypothetical protein
MKIVPAMLVASVLLLLPATVVPQQNGSWSDDTYYDGTVDPYHPEVGPGYVIKITSISTNRLTCTVTWNGTKTGDATIDHTVGRNIAGSFVLVLPAYPGNGAAKTASYRITNIADLQHHILCA